MAAILMRNSKPCCVLDPADFIVVFSKLRRGKVLIPIIEVILNEKIVNKNGLILRSDF